MHAQTPAEAADRDEEVDEVGPGSEQLPKLVDQHQQVRKWRQRLSLRQAVLVIAQRRQVAGRSQQLLPSPDLAKQRRVHPVDHGEVIRQVGDQPGHVGKLLETCEGGTALEVGEHERQQVWRVCQRESRHDGAQQLALAGTCGADDQTVRSVTAQCRLLQIEHHGLAVAAHPDGNSQALGQGSASPGHGRIQRTNVAHTKETGQRDRVGEARARLLRQPQRRQPARHRLCAARTQTVCAAVGRWVGRSQVLDVQPAGRDPDADVDFVRLLRLATAEYDQGRPAWHATQQAHGLRSWEHPVRHHDQPGAGIQQVCSGLDLASTRHSGRDEGVEHGGVVDRLRTGFALSPVLRTTKMRQPFDPLPVRSAGRRRAQQQAELFRGMKHGQLAAERSGHVESRSPGAQDAEHACASQIDSNGSVGNRSVRLHQLVRGRNTDWIRGLCGTVLDRDG